MQTDGLDAPKMTKRRTLGRDHTSGAAWTPQRRRLVDFLRLVDRLDVDFLADDFLRPVDVLADDFLRLVDFLDGDFEPRPPARAARFFTDSPISSARSTALSTTTPTTLCPTSVLSAFSPNSLPFVRPSSRLALRLASNTPLRSGRSRP
jgi:hypothetical protein